jgi:putative flippase GtrA
MSNSSESLQFKVVRWLQPESHNDKISRFVFSYVWKYRQFIVFLAGGGLGALTNWVISFFLTSIEGLHYIVSFSLAQLINITVNFLWHTYITFNVKDKAGNRFVRFLLMSIMTASLSIGLVYLTKEYLLDRVYKIYLFKYDLNYLAAIIMITFFVSVINFTISRLWVFRKNESR